MDDGIRLQGYAPGVPTQIDTRAWPSVRHLADSAMARYATKPAFTSMGTTLDFAAVDRLSRDFAAVLQQDLGLQRGDRLAVMLPNLLQYPVVLFAAFRAGLTVVNINPQYTARELERQLLDAGACAIVVLENFACTVEQVLPRCALRSVVVTRLGDLLAAPRSFVANFVARHVRHLVPPWAMPQALMFGELMERRRGHLLQPADLGPEDIAFIQYTSGTTGAPKGAVLTHGNVVANVLQNNAWCDTVVKPGQETVVTPLPLYHVLSLMVNLLAYFNFGGHNLLIADARDLHGLVRELARHPFSVIVGVNTLYRALLDAPEFARVDTSHLKSAIVGGAPAQAAVAERWQARTGVALVEGYGLTEAGVLTCNRLDCPRWDGSVGLPYPSTEISIRDDDDHVLAAGSIGEVCARGPQVMRGYWNRPEDTAQAFTPSGWLRTGDVGTLEAGGRLRLVDRKKDMIVVSGFKVYPAEVEAVVAELPGVADCAAIGMADAASGEAVRLLVVRSDTGLAADAVMAHCRARLTAYKCPKAVEFRASLPKTPIGKVLKRALRERGPAAAAMDAAV